MTPVFRPGVRPNDPTKARLVLGPRLDVADVTPPPSADWTPAVKSWPMDGNNMWGDCVFAMIGHAIQAWTANASKESVPAVADLLAAYSAVTGFDPNAGPPGNNPTDQGTVMQDAFNFWRKNGVAGHKLLAFAQVDHTSEEQMQAACALFGSLLVAINFPAIAMDQFNQGKPWDVVRSDGGIEGGHAVLGVKYDAASGKWYWITWGKAQEVTFAFVKKYIVEAWVGISQEWVDATGHTPSGLDLQGLGEDFAALTGSPNPFPGPNPPQPPQPPQPPPPPATDDLQKAAVALADDPSVGLWVRERHIGRAAVVAHRIQAILAALRA